MNSLSFFSLMSQYGQKRVSGIGEVTANNTVKCVIPSVTVSGAVTQARYKGLNFFDVNESAIDLSDVQAYGSSIIPYTEQFNKRLKSNVTYTISYTATGLADTPDNFTSINNPILGFSFYVPKGGYSSVSVARTTREWLEKGETARIVRSFSLPDASAFSLGVYTQRANTTDGSYMYNRVSFSDIMVVEGEYSKDTFPEYEPYTGTFPAPNVAYPFAPVHISPTLRSGDSVVACPFLRATPDGSVRDTYETQSGKRLARLEELVLRGNGSITATSDDKGVIFENALPYSCNNAKGVCNYSIIGESMILGKNNRHIYWNNALEVLGMTVDEFKAWLSSEEVDRYNPVTIHFESGSPVLYVNSVSSRLNQENGTTRIYQTDGSNAPLEVTFLTRR